MPPPYKMPIACLNALWMVRLLYHVELFRGVQQQQLDGASALPTGVRSSSPIILRKNTN